MRRITKIILASVAVIGLGGIFYFLLHGADIAVLNPKGQIADKQRDLMIIATILGMSVVLPVFIMLFVFAWKYREGNTKARYMPDWQNNRIIETVWWGVPFIIITILGVIAWQSSHELDPYRSLDSSKKPVKIQVVALQWRWLFIYPDDHIASLSEVRFPVNTPVDFEITADAPMNSFWIPKLGGQVYAMTGMSTQLHLQANEKGDYPGSSANISGEGFADMKFTAKVVSDDDFARWKNDAKTAKEEMNSTAYAKIAEPSKDTTPRLYTLSEIDLYDTIVMKYMDIGNH
ncbi:MAG TPA: ubiquinol oxidase subunit II [Candidatus Saccharimonadales bacterium]|nr:ubiquinol oxidase subunit II [Candidatus Saccharimonadales bacterium]